jgi:hypothetical protein
VKTRLGSIWVGSGSTGAAGLQADKIKETAAIIRNSLVKFFNLFSPANWCIEAINAGFGRLPLVCFIEVLAATL